MLYFFYKKITFLFNKENDDLQSAYNVQFYFFHENVNFYNLETDNQTAFQAHLKNKT